MNQEHFIYFHLRCKKFVVFFFFNFYVFILISAALKKNVTVQKSKSVKQVFQGRYKAALDINSFLLTLGSVAHKIVFLIVTLIFYYI